MNSVPRKLEKNNFFWKMSKNLCTVTLSYLDIFGSNFQLALFINLNTFFGLLHPPLERPRACCPVSQACLPFCVVNCTVPHPTLTHLSIPRQLLTTIQHPLISNCLHHVGVREEGFFLHMEVFVPTTRIPLNPPSSPPSFPPHPQPNPISFC